MCQVTPYTLPCCRRTYVSILKLPSCPEEWPKLKCPPELCIQTGDVVPDERHEGTCWRCQAQEAGKSQEEKEKLRPGIDRAGIVHGLEELGLSARIRLLEEGGQCWNCKATRGCHSCGSNEASLPASGTVTPRRQRDSTPSKKRHRDMTSDMGRSGSRRIKRETPGSGAGAMSSTLASARSTPRTPGSGSSPGFSLAGPATPLRTSRASGRLLPYPTPSPIRPPNWAVSQTGARSSSDVFYDGSPPFAPTPSSLRYSSLPESSQLAPMWNANQMNGSVWTSQGAIAKNSQLGQLGTTSTLAAPPGNSGPLPSIGSFLNSTELWRGSLSDAVPQDSYPLPQVNWQQGNSHQNDQMMWQGQQPETYTQTRGDIHYTATAGLENSHLNSAVPYDSNTMASILVNNIQHNTGMNAPAANTASQERASGTIQATPTPPNIDPALVQPPIITNTNTESGPDVSMAPMSMFDNYHYNNYQEDYPTTQAINDAFEEEQRVREAKEAEESGFNLQYYPN